jgi:hypothetical protein
MIMVIDKKKLLRAYQQVIATLQQLDLEADTESTALNTYLDALENFRQKLFLRVSNELDNQVMITSEDLTKHLSQFLLEMRTEHDPQLNEDVYYTYASIDAYFNSLIVSASDKLTEIMNAPRQRKHTRGFQGQFLTQIPRADYHQIKADAIDFILKSRFTKFVSFNLVQEQTQCQRKPISDEQKLCIYKFINKRVSIDKHDTTTQYLRTKIVEDIDVLIKHNKQQQEISFFNYNKQNYAIRINEMRKLRDHLFGPKIIISRELADKAKRLKQACNLHTSLFCRLFSTQLTKTAAAIERIEEKIHNNKLTTRFREETEVHLKNSL